MERHSDVVAAWRAGVQPAWSIEADRPIGQALRRLKQRWSLWLALSDLGGMPLEAVTRGLSDLADLTLDRAIDAALAERGGGAGFVAIALGKGGSRELNFSSDIDPILLFDPERLPCRAREDPAEAAVRIARRVVELMQARDADGYVFRMDLRLRPASEVTPIALSVDAAIMHYESSALDWERAAFIRARAAAGDVALGERMLATIRPFVWRRSLDFGAIDAIRALTRRIRAHGGAVPFGPGYDLKKGRGGIREIEFFAQIHQLIHGGRDPALRVPATLDALAALGRAGRIDPDVAARLADAYRILRTVEHRLQMVDDRQTHQLPDGEALDNVARLHGLPDGDALLDLLRPHVDLVGRTYDALDGDVPTPQQGAEPDPAARFARFADPDAAADRIDRWRRGVPRALKSEAATSALERTLPALIDALSHAPDPDGALVRADRLVERLPSAVNIFRLLDARPALLTLFVAICAHAPALADALGRRPTLMDGLIDASALEPVPSVDALVAAWSRGDGQEPYELLLDRIRAEVAERRFALGVQIVAAAADPIDVAAGYSRVAEAALQLLTRATIADHQRSHGRIAGAGLIVLAFGRLGGAALTHASDLDLVFLHDGVPGEQSDGGRPLDTTRYFNRLAQRVTAALSVPTAAGPLYPVDTRLRPSGMDGLLCASVESFADYQRGAAWTWEHMALTRARVVFGTAEQRGRLNDIILETLRRPRDAATLRADVVGMRAEMARHKPAQGELDVKLERGGLVDLEFCVHHRQLATGTALVPELARAIAMLVEGEQLPPDFVDAHAVLSRMLVTLRLVAPRDEALDPPTQALVAAACRLPDWPALLAAHAAARQTVSEVWQAIEEAV
ncbi:bifunctional [glutamate--ammonia ligase]-adenylyl-L-tyrosine phosphorylase/[glutamate--ammonia-ligase] adenylyltransferase [Sphingomonas jejuensis]|nr:bifunctional [glutamate--ammonia ligase]-adenylyl-L-tyrosine phosphorylase/[glutamate--ammonia-ligase] adenylyltransferase [Sphingomonas jejuensis]